MQPCYFFRIIYLARCDLWKRSSILQLATAVVCFSLLIRRHCRSISPEQINPGSIKNKSANQNVRSSPSHVFVKQLNLGIKSCFRRRRLVVEPCSHRDHSFTVPVRLVSNRSMTQAGPRCPYKLREQYQNYDGNLGRLFMNQ